MSSYESRESPQEGRDSIVHEQYQEIIRNTEVLPDGREVIVEGDIHHFAALNAHQGQNSLGFEGTCGLASVKNVLGEYGSRITEDEVVNYAAKHDLCEHGDGKAPEILGATTVSEQVQILNDYGAKAHAETSLETDDVAGILSDGHGVILEVNAGVLWNNAHFLGHGEYNHAVTAVGVARDPDTGAVVGVYINDTGTGASARLVDVETLKRAWQDAGGAAVVVESSYL